MVITNTPRKAGPYFGDDVATTFAYAFRVLSSADLEVRRSVIGEVADVLELDVDYTVTGVDSDDGGDVVLLTPLATGERLDIIGAAAYTQPLSLENQGPYFARDVMRALDRIVVQAQQLKELVDRAVVARPEDGVTDLSGLIDAIADVADIRDDVVAVAAASGDIETVAGIAADVTTVASVSSVALAAVAAVADDIPAVAAAADDIATVADNLADVTNFADVYLGPHATEPALRNDGSALQQGDLYFDTVVGVLRYWDGAAWGSATSAVNGTLLRYEYVATAAQTTFAAVYDPGFVDVWLNGVKLSSSDFTATSGTSVVLAVGAALDDEVCIIGYGSFVVADALAKTQNGADIPDVAAFRANIGLTYASEAEAKAGTAANRSMTPQRNRQAGLGRPHAVAYDEKAQNTAAQTVSATTWTTLNLNTEVDPDGLITLSSDTVTPTEDLYMEARLTPYALNTVRMRVYNVTDGVVTSYSGSYVAHPSYSGTPAVLVRADLAAGKTYRVEFYKAAAGSLVGQPTNISGVPERYLETAYWRR